MRSSDEAETKGFCYGSELLACTKEGCPVPWGIRYCLE